MSVALETGIPSRNDCRRHPRAESFELHVYYLTYTLLRSSGVPQSVVYPSGSNYRPGAACIFGGQSPVRLQAAGFAKRMLGFCHSIWKLGCTVSGTANCAGLSVPNFMLRQEESSSYSCMLLLNTLQTPFPLRLLHPALRPEHYSSIILFPWINSSASQAT